LIIWQQFFDISHAFSLQSRTNKDFVSRPSVFVSALRIFYAILVSMTATWLPLLPPLPELSCVSLECVDVVAGSGKLGVKGVRGVFAPSLKMSMLESWLFVKRIFD
jgi:RecA/RadA recombinase